MRISLKRLRKARYQPKFEVGFLKTNKDLKEKVVIEVKNKFQLLEDLNDTDELWNGIKTSINETIQENIPQKPRK